MKRCVFAFALVVALASSGLAAEKVKTVVSAPVRANAGAGFTVDALVSNPSAEPQTITYEGTGAGFAIDASDAKRTLWLAPNASAVVTWNCKAAQAGSASFTLSIDGAPAGQAAAIAVGPARPTQPGTASMGNAPASIQMPEKPGKYEIEIEFIGGVWGEYAAGMERLESLHGFSTNALVARLLVPFAAKEQKEPPDLSVLYALQLPSGAWAAAPNGIADFRSTSWVVFWLGHFAKAGGSVDAKALEKATAFLKEKAAAADPEMRARILPALAAVGQPIADIKFTDAELAQLSTAAKLLAAYGGANIPLPPAAEWPKLSALELSALACCLANQNDPKLDVSSLPSLIAKAEGAAPSAETHQVPLLVLAFGKLKEKTSRPDFTVTIRQGGKRLKSVDVDRRHPVVREVISVTTTQPRETIALESKEPGVIYRAVVRAGQ